MNRLVVSQAVSYDSSRVETMDRLDQRFTSLISEKLGFHPFPIPNAIPTHSDVLSWLEIVNPDGIILTGGGALGEFESRDRIEGILLAFAIENGVPILGICRGMQFISSQFGAGLERVKGHAGTRHMVSGRYNMEVNSYHDWSLKSCPPTFSVTCFSGDDRIEAIAHDTLKIEGWMWHPEREVINHEAVQRDLKNFFSAKDEWNPTV